MKTDSFTSKDFLKKLDQRKNYDLFGIDMHENIHWGKLFIHLFGEYFSRYTIWIKVNQKELTDSLTQLYSLEQSQILRIDKTNEENSFEVDYTYSEVMLILKKGFMVSIVNGKVDLLYGSNISEIERMKVVMKIDEHKFDYNLIRKFHMIQHYNGYFELTDFDIKPFDLDLEMSASPK